MITPAQKKLLFLSSLGGVLEFYDFVIYALFSTYISQTFFPTDNRVTSLLITFATFSAGYLARPFGGVLFGHFGDRYGRKKTFTFSILLMAIATFAVALIPSYNRIGITAPIFLTLLRILQGLSVGGEIPGAITYVSESMPTRKGFACGIIFFSLIMGLVMGSLIQALLSLFLSEQHMLTWGWRLPFAIGGLFGFLSYLLRRTLEESALFRAIEDKTERFPIFKVLQEQTLSAFSAIFTVGLGASLIVLLFLFIPSYLTQVLHIPENHYIWYQTANTFLFAILIAVFGILSDKINHRLMLFLSAIFSILLAYPIFIIYVHHFSFFLVAFLLSALITGFAWGVIPSHLTDLFPTSIRYSGVAWCYNLGFAIFGGLAPLIAMTLIKKTAWVAAPMLFLIFSGILALFALLIYQSKKRTSRLHG